MKLSFSFHFQQAVFERGIDINHLKKTIREPDSSKATFGGRTVSRKTVEGKLLEVVYTRGGRNEYKIITAYSILN